MGQHLGFTLESTASGTKALLLKPFVLPEYVTRPSSLQIPGPQPEPHRAGDLLGRVLIIGAAQIQNVLTLRVRRKGGKSHD